MLSAWLRVMVVLTAVSGISFPMPPPSTAELPSIVLFVMYVVNDVLKELFSSPPPSFEAVLPPIKLSVTVSMPAL